MTPRELSSHLAAQIRAALNARACHVFFDNSRERTIAVVVRDDDRTDVFYHDASSDDDDYAFYLIDCDLSSPSCIPAFFVAIPDA